METARRRLLRAGIRRPRVTTVTGSDGRPRRVQVVSAPTRTAVLRPDGSRTVALMLTQLLQGATDTVAALGAHHGTQDFEGRSLPGWHRHRALVSAAHAYQRLNGAGEYSVRAA
ncbi:hypothetical protein [Streptomyces sp. SM10]|uniref:hypothetical protein n=1 Tax=Streptomyces sp. SM10 TaxID=565556 RepID=UPI000CD4E4B7|nr:hypothetical protein [Streptomyces sp. SM10]